MKYVLQALVQSLKEKPLERQSVDKVEWNPYALSNIEKSPKLTQDYLWTVSLARQWK